MVQPPIEVDAEWFDDLPVEPGLYWFLGELHMGSMGGHYSGSIKPEFELRLVTVVRTRNGLTAHSSGHFVSMCKWDKEKMRTGVLGKWAQVMIPKRPKL